MLLLVFAGAIGFLTSVWLAWSLGALPALAIATAVGALAITGASLVLAGRRSGCKPEESNRTARRRAEKPGGEPN